nr:hypothetical protein CFP56_53198 [Quercus suber]
MFPPPTTLPFPPPEQLSITQGLLPPTEVSTTAEMAKGKKSIKGGPQPKEVKPLTKAKDTKDALTIKDVASKAKNAESKSKAGPKKDPP